MVLFAIASLFLANYGYGLAHEAAHAAVIDALGGHVSGIYVDALGIDAYTEHTAVSGTTDLVLVNAAGLCMTTVLALAFTAMNQGLLAAFLAGRTAIYAFNYTPGTDISTIHAVAGQTSIFISLFLVAINLACIYIVLKPSGTLFNGFHRLRVWNSHQADAVTGHVNGDIINP
jgi:hypothetical protein